MSLVLESTVQNGVALALETTVLTCAVQDVTPKVGNLKSAACSTSESLRSSESATFNLKLVVGLGLALLYHLEIFERS